MFYLVIYIKSRLSKMEFFSKTFNKNSETVKNFLNSSVEKGFLYSTPARPLNLRNQLCRNLKLPGK